MAVDLLFRSGAAPSGGRVDLLLEAPAPPDIVTGAGRLAVRVAAHGIASRIARGSGAGRVPVTAAGQAGPVRAGWGAAGLTVRASALGVKLTGAPVGPSAAVRAAWRRGLPAQARRAVISPEASRRERVQRIETRAGQPVARAVAAGQAGGMARERAHDSRWRAGGSRSAGVSTRHHGRLEAASASAGAPWQGSFPVALALAGRSRTLWGVEVVAAVACADGAPIAAASAALFGQGTPILTAWQGRWRWGLPPRPGRRIRAILIPEPPMPHSGPVDLFLEAGTGAPSILLLRTASRFTARIVPLRRVYIVWDSAQLIRLSDGRPIGATALSVATDADSWVWSLQASLASAADVALLEDPNGEPVEVRATFNGHAFDFVLSPDPERSWSGSGDGAPHDAGTVRGLSLGSYLGEPWAPIGVWTNEETRNARQLAADVLPYGASLAWDCEDWPVAAGAWSHRGRPHTALLRIAESAGGVLASDATGLGFTIAPRYPVLPWQWAAAEPWALIPRAYCQSLSERGVSDQGYNAVWVVGERGGVVGRVLRAGTAGDREATQITDALATSPVMARQRGGVALARAGRKAEVSLGIPVGNELGMIPLGKLIAVGDLGGPWRGLSRAVQVSARIASDGVAEVGQSVRLEKYLGESSRYGATAFRHNPWAAFQDLTQGEPRLCGTVTAHHGDGSSSVELLGGGVLRVRGTEVAVGHRAFVQDGKLDGEATGTLTDDIEI